MADRAPPEGFQPHFRKSPLTDPWEPLYSKVLPDRVVIGLYVREPHTNSRGMLHGGLIAALADNAMGLSCGQVLDGGGSQAGGRAGDSVAWRLTSLARRSWASGLRSTRSM